MAGLVVTIQYFPSPSPIVCSDAIPARDAGGSIGLEVMTRGCGCEQWWFAEVYGEEKFFNPPANSWDLGRDLVVRDGKRRQSSTLPVLG